MSNERPEPSDRKISHAQNGEDVRAWRALRDQGRAFYVEVGASDPVVDSVTASLNALGWHGVLVEAEPTIAQALRESRPDDVVVAAAAHSSAGLLTFTYANKRGQGTVATGAAGQSATEGQRRVSVPAVRLADVLDDVSPSVIHFMSIDVEGHESEVLKGLQLDRWRPWVLCVEATLPDSREPSWQSWHPLLAQADYDFVAFDGLNRWYVSAEHRDLADRVAEPYSVLDRFLDGWRRRDEVEQCEHIERLKAETERLKAETERLNADIAQLNAEIARLQTVLGEQSATVEQQQTELVAANAEVQAGRREARTLTAELDSANGEIKRLGRDLHQTSTEREALTAEIKKLRNSTSWRVTRPLRATGQRTGLKVDRGLIRKAKKLGRPPRVTSPPTHADDPSDTRRRRAFTAKLTAARLRADSR